MASHLRNFFQKHLATSNNNTFTGSGWDLDTNDHTGCRDLTKESDPAVAMALRSNNPVYSYQSAEHSCIVTVGDSKESR